MTYMLHKPMVTRIRRPRWLVAVLCALGVIM